MLSAIGEASRRSLIEGIVPASIRRATTMQIPAAITEAAIRLFWWGDGVGVAMSYGTI